MPIFEFKCQNCGNKFEELLRGKDSLNNLYCPYCQNKNIEKIISKFSIAQGRNAFRSNSIEKDSTSKCSGCSANSCSNCNL